MARPSNFLFIIFFFITKTFAVFVLDELGMSYDVKVYHFEHCDKRGKYELLSNMKIGKLNRTHLIYSGTFDTRVDVDDKVKIHATAALKVTNGRYSAVIDLKTKACDMVKTFVKDIFVTIADHCNRTFECPIKRFRCDLKDYILNMKFNNIPSVPFGDYRVEFSLIRTLPYATEEIISCLRIYGAAGKPTNPKHEKTRKKNE